MSFTKDDRKDQAIRGKTFPVGHLSETIGDALHREFDRTQSAVKTVVELTGANEKTVRNWFEAKNAPSAAALMALCRHSDHVLEAVLLLAGRTQHLKARKVVEARQKLEELLVLVRELEG